MIGNECPFINDRVTTISGHFFAICMFIFHKTEVQTVILRCLTGLNLNRFNSYGLDVAGCLMRVRWTLKKLQLINSHFTTTWITFLRHVQFHLAWPYFATCTVPVRICTRVSCDMYSSSQYAWPYFPTCTVPARILIFSMFPACSIHTYNWVEPGYIPTHTTGKKVPTHSF